MDRKLIAMCAVALLAAGAVVVVKLRPNPLPTPDPAVLPIIEKSVSRTPSLPGASENPKSPPSTPVTEVVQQISPEPTPSQEQKVDLTPYTSVVKGEENPDAIPYGTAGFVTFARYERLVRRDPGRGMEAIQRELELTEETTRRFVQYMRSADDELLVRRKRARDDFCSRRSSILTIEDAARESQEMNDVVHAARVEIVKNAESVLGPEGMAKLEEQIGKQRRSITRTSIDSSQALYALGRTPDDLMKQMCDSQTGSEKNP